MTSPVNDLQRHSLVPPSGADFNQKNPVDCVVDQMVRKMKKLAKKTFHVFFFGENLPYGWNYSVPSREITSMSMNLK